MSNGKDLSLENESSSSIGIKEQKKQIKELQKEVNFWSNTAQAYLKSLQRLEAENDNKDLEIEELKAAIRQLKKEVGKLLEEKNKKIATLTDELHDTSKNSRFLNDWSATNKVVKGHSKRDTFIRMLTNNLSAERIKEELGDIQQGWENDLSLQVLTQEDKQKIAAYDDLEVQDLPQD